MSRAIAYGLPHPMRSVLQILPSQISKQKANQWSHRCRTTLQFCRWFLALAMLQKQSGDRTQLIEDVKMPANKENEVTKLQSTFLIEHPLNKDPIKQRSSHDESLTTRYKIINSRSKLLYFEWFPPSHTSLTYFTIPAIRQGPLRSGPCEKQEEKSALIKSNEHGKKTPTSATLHV